MPNRFKYTQKLTNVLKKAEQKGKLKLGFIGGSITQGCSPTIPENAYVERVTNWFKNRFPNLEVERINAGVGATGSLIGVHRVDRDIIVHKPDIVFVEFAANDVSPKNNTNLSYESLIRKLVTKLPDAAIVEIFMTLQSGESAEEEEAKVAKHYQLPTVSYRQEIFKQIEMGSYKWEDVETDEVHPNDRGHGIVADLITSLMDVALAQEVDLAFKFEVPKTTVFGVPYLEGELIEFKDLKLINEVGFKSTKELFRTINTGYEAIDDTKQVTLTCEVEGRNAFLLYVKGIEEDRAQIEISVNGAETKVLDTFFENGWGNYPETEALFMSDVKQTITIKIHMKQDDARRKLNLLGFLVS